MCIDFASSALAGVTFHSSDVMKMKYFRYSLLPDCLPISAMLLHPLLGGMNVELNIVKLHIIYCTLTLKGIFTSLENIQKYICCSESAIEIS